MFDKLPVEKILFFDIETVSTKISLENESEVMQQIWQKKHSKIIRDESISFAESYESNAAIYAEFGKVVCISCGYFHEGQFRVKSFYGDNEKQVLEGFAKLLNSNFQYKHLCGHNIKEFDVPYLCRRMWINGVKLPYILNIAGKKPWEVNFIDTMQLWKFGDYKNYTSLELLSAVFGIPTPKDDIDGSQVGKIYWQNQDLERIKIYCEKDVVTVARLFQKYRNEPMLDDGQILFV